MTDSDWNAIKANLLYFMAGQEGKVQFSDYTITREGGQVVLRVDIPIEVSP